VSLECVYDYKHLETVVSARHLLIATTRLQILEAVLGSKTFSALAAVKEAEWLQKYAETDAKLRALPPCGNYGQSLTLLDRGGPMCGKCASEQCLPEHPQVPAAEPTDPSRLDDDDLAS
jgi:hypothetical protein